MFGNNANDRFIAMCTFSDGKTLAEETLKNARFKILKYQRFNNSAIFEKCPDN